MARYASPISLLLVAHAVAEEEKVYPDLRRARAIGAHEEEHGEEEHAEINEALLAFLEAKGTDTQKYDDALEELATTDGVLGVVFRGRRYDTGDRVDYIKAIVQLASDRDDLGPQLRPWLKEFAAQL